MNSGERMLESPRNYAIVGAGAIGGTLAWFLADAGHPVWLIDTDAAHLNAISTDGLSLERNGQRYSRNVDSVFSADGCPGGLNRVLLSVKANATAAAAEWLAEHLAEDGFVVSMQNGLNEAVLTDVLGADRVVGAFVDLFADVIAPGVIRDGGGGALAVGEMDGTISTRVQETVDDLQAWGPAVVTSNVQGYLWSKLALGAMLACTALADEDMDLLIDRHRPSMYRLAGEVLTLAEQLGITPEPFDAFMPQAYLPSMGGSHLELATDALVTWLNGQTKKRSGIWRDIAVRHRPTEVPAQFEPVLTSAAAFSLEVPVLRAMLDQLAEVEEAPGSMSEERLCILDGMIPGGR